ncbi:tRNA (adenosine(37)-N6)-threonylcarbamoyltransferase complex dimerization subunit type 1 TsaB [Reinekea blandensis]|uniref:tRNA threonylcarbamoyladenosine biosynthesis protein TsaB n=1 Tax=Reinekea blandensis MED297 TaxID=314283 RepID=A4BC05_9GAMM|nr:tRNA (adenosine(37)-N6)-threonylcarbamoyltransferase complex dimerization subunit type 1 TsaB [Reinekea blandensis]EAR10490.1 hypothetical protein MED297_01675 [Reinekea sp. MED297] [Reinekea blandensis MED297]
MNNILSIDTTADICSIAVQTPDRAVRFHEQRPRQHAKILLPEIERLLTEVELSVPDLDLIVFGRGPGSFTGVRIAAGVTQGLAFSAGCPVMPVSTLQSLAFSSQGAAGDCIWTALDARMNEIYFARYVVNEQGIPVAIDEEQVLPPSAITEELSASVLLVGNGWQAGYTLPMAVQVNIDQKPVQFALPDAFDSLKLAQRLLAADMATPVSADQAIPVYLRDNVTWDNKPKVGS